MKGAERYITPELKTFEDKVLSASERALAREKMLYDALLDSARTVHPEPLQTAADAMAELDVLAGFAERADTLDWRRPELNDTPGRLIASQGPPSGRRRQVGHAVRAQRCALR